jgi:hypothetical protein
VPRLTRDWTSGNRVSQLGAAIPCVRPYRAVPARLHGPRRFSRYATVSRTPALLRMYWGPAAPARRSHHAASARRPARGRHLRGTAYLAHYNKARPHRSFRQLTPAQADTRRPGPVNLAQHPIRRKQVLGGLTYEYCVAA